MDFDAEDERQIARLVVQYADAVSSASPEQWADTWAADGRWVLRTRTVEGRSEILEAWRQFLPTYESVVQMVTQGWVDATPTGARGRWLVLEIFRRSGGSDDIVQVTSYTDRYVVEGQRWLFAERRIAVVYRRTAPPGEFLAWVPILAANPSDGSS